VEAEVVAAPEVVEEVVQELHLKQQVPLDQEWW